MSGGRGSASLSCSDPGPEVSKRAVTQAAYRARQKARLRCLRAGNIGGAACPLAIRGPGISDILLRRSCTLQ